MDIIQNNPESFTGPSTEPFTERETHLIRQTAYGIARYAGWIKFLAVLAIISGAFSLLASFFIGVAITIGDGADDIFMMQMQESDDASLTPGADQSADIAPGPFDPINGGEPHASFLLNSVFAFVGGIFSCWLGMTLWKVSDCYKNAAHTPDIAALEQGSVLLARFFFGMGIYVLTCIALYIVFIFMLVTVLRSEF